MKRSWFRGSFERLGMNVQRLSQEEHWEEVTGTLEKVSDKGEK